MFVIAGRRIHPLVLAAIAAVLAAAAVAAFALAAAHGAPVRGLADTWTGHARPLAVTQWNAVPARGAVSWG